MYNSKIWDKIKSFEAEEAEDEIFAASYDALEAMEVNLLWCYVGLYKVESESLLTLNYQRYEQKVFLLREVRF